METRGLDGGLVRVLNAGEFRNTVHTEPVLSGIEWYGHGQVREAIDRARQQAQPLYVDYRTPGCQGTAWMDAHAYRAPRVEALLGANFVCIRYDIQRPDADFSILSPTTPLLWTPTLVVLDHGLSEMRRLVGALPPDELLAELEVGLALIALRRRELDEAIERLRHVADRVPPPSAGAEALYWAGVAAYYRAGRSRPALLGWWKEIGARYPRSAWWARASTLISTGAGMTAA